MKILKTFRTYFLLFAGFSVVAHMMIPHDHHLFNSETAEDHCPATHQHAPLFPVFPAHCHAFNDMAAEKASVFTIKKDTQHSIAEIIPVPVSLSAGLSFSGWLIPFNWDHSTSGGAAGPSRLRAPPVCS